MSPAEALLRRWMDSGDHGLLAGDVVWEVSPGYPVPRTSWRGRAEVEGVFFPTLRRTFPVWRIRPSAFAPLADGRLVVTGHYEAGHADGREGQVPFQHLWTIAGDRIAAVEAVADFAAFAG
ncbi:nuclear transport factor 2 family protein [Roseomonas sp. OT10]|uniref:nuclear transport factor 2 family protein n=1 Tax=Roseomonas cutis TaxID=2897332 RepID=UPI001E61D487|nr:nuclear transport factor 2 family protein [Roseomonas sp. OT10]UFN51173.1 nuclear transport factor 2 family protein [Roseomonas sp. OT10]